MDYKKLIKNREKRLSVIRLFSFVPDELYLRIVYRIKTGKKLNIRHPVGFNEKLNWLKLNNQCPEYTDLVDKVKVRQIVEKKIGPGHFFPLLGTWEHFKDINFDILPNEFVLKCNHDSGSVRMIYDKYHIDKIELESFFEKRLKLNPFCLGREYPYKNVRPCILAEKLMKTDGGGH